ncbi:unnamed protein product [Calypogeia fissa]
MALNTEDKRAKTGPPTKEKQAKTDKGIGLRFSSLLKHLYKSFEKKNVKKSLQRRLLCASIMSYGEDQRADVNRPRKVGTKPTRWGEKFQKSDVDYNLLYHPHHVRTAPGGPSLPETNTIAAPVYKSRKPPLPPLAAGPSSTSVTKSSAAIDVAAKQEKHPTLPSSAPTDQPSSSETSIPASVNVVKRKNTLPLSAPTTPGHSPRSGGTTSAADSPETLYTAIHKNSGTGTRFMPGSRRDSSGPISFSYANSDFSNAAYKSYSPSPSPSPSIRPQNKSPSKSSRKSLVSTISPKSGSRTKYVAPESPDGLDAASLPASYISRDGTPSVKFENASPSPTAVKLDGAHSATHNYLERRPLTKSSPKWTDNIDAGGPFYALRPLEAESSSPARPFKVVNKNHVRRSSVGSIISPEAQSPVSLSKLSPNYNVSKLSPDTCISPSTNPSESVRAKRRKSSRPNSVENIDEEEQRSGLSILRSHSPQTGTRCNGSNFSPFMQAWPSKPDLLEYTSKPRSISANDTRAKASKGVPWNESAGSYRSSPMSSHESDKEAPPTAGLADVKKEPITTRPSTNLASLWSLEGKQSTSSAAQDAGSASKKQSSQSCFTKSRRSRSSSNIAELAANGEKETPKRLVRQSSLRYTSIDFDRAKAFLSLGSKSKNDGRPVAVPESSGKSTGRSTGGGPSHSRRKSSTGSPNNKRMPFSFSSPDITKLHNSDTETTSKPKVQPLHRAASYNANRSKIAVKFHDGPLTPESDVSRPREPVTRYVRKNSFSSILELLRSGRKLNGKMADLKDTDDLTDSSAKSPIQESTEYRAELPNKVFSISENPLYSPSPSENLTKSPVHKPAENPLYVPSKPSEEPEEKPLYVPRKSAAEGTGDRSASRSGESAGHRKRNSIGGPSGGVFSQNVSIPDCSVHATGLPPDMWQLVFCFLPRHQILGDLRIVCHEWQSAVDNSLFLPRMKQYQVLHDVQNKPSLALSATKIEKWLSESQLTTVVGLLQHLRSNPFTTAPDKLASSLRLQYLAQDKDSAMLDPWRNCIGTLDALSREFEGDTWCLALLLILLVCEGPILQNHLNCLLSGKSGSCRSETVEFLYLVLTAITASCWEDDRQPLLYELERAIGYTEFVDGEKSLKDGFFCFTAEQHEILNTKLLPDQIMVIKAFPGTGKTSTLLEYANRRRESNFVYVIFDRFVVNEGETSFPPNTKCVNFQKLAYAKVGWQYRHKLHSSNLSPVLVKAALGVSSHAAVYFILLTLERFLQSADFTLKDCHVPEKAITSNPRAEVPYYLGKAEKLWTMMTDKGSREIPMTHQGYLKLYQLSESLPDNQYDCWLCDEVQNATPVMADIVLRQTGCSKILAGDPHQQIHGFGDLGDLIQKVKGDAGVLNLKLTYSFRFGREIAWTCNYLLQLKGEKEDLIGVRSTSKKHLSPIGNVQSDFSYTGKERGGTTGQIVFIARSNAKAFEVALQCRRRKLGFIGGLKAYQLDLMRDTWHLMKGNHNRIQDSYIKRAYRGCGAVELLARLKVVDAHKEDLPKRLDAVQAMDVGVDITSAEVLFSTAYKAKGLEFDIVALTNDFVEVSPVKSLGGKLFVEDDTLQEGKREVDAQELNLLYVAASRAKSRLLLNDDVDNYLRLGGRGLRREPRPLLQYVKDSFSCISCQKPYNSCLAIISGRWNDSEDSSNNDPTSLDDSLLESPSSPIVQILERNQCRTNGFFKVCLCLSCAGQLQRLPGHLAKFAGGAKMIASVFT